jgi:hypothetical protein
MAARTQARRPIVRRTAGTWSAAPPREAFTAVGIAVRTPAVRTGGRAGHGRARKSD